MRRLPRIRPLPSRLAIPNPSISLQIVSQCPARRAIATSAPRKGILDRFTKSKDSSSKPAEPAEIDPDSLLPEERARLREEQQRARREQEDQELATAYPEFELEPPDAAAEEAAAEVVPTFSYLEGKTVKTSGTLVLPPSERAIAPRPSEIDDPHYEPAKDWTGLPQVGGYHGWWDRKGHWTTKFVAFAPRADQKVTYNAVLEAALRRAVVEALVIRKERPEKLSAAWEVGGKEDYKRALRVKINVENGVGKVEGDVKGILRAVLPEEEPTEEEEEEEDEDQPEQDDIVEERDEETPPDVQVEGGAGEAKKEKSYRGYLHVTQAQKYVKTFGKEWRTIRLDDPKLRFAIAKRLYQLTANRISDFKLHSMYDVNSVLNALLKKPKPAKLIDAIWQDVTELPKLPNVRVYGRRLTPIDKETQVGRWKVIKKELEKRGLPVTGHRHLPKPVMATWIKGRA